MLEYWLWLAGRRGIGARGLCALLAQFGTPEAVFCPADAVSGAAPGERRAVASG